MKVSKHCSILKYISVEFFKTCSEYVNQPCHCRVHWCRVFFRNVILLPWVPSTCTYHSYEERSRGLGRLIIDFRVDETWPFWGTGLGEDGGSTSDFSRVELESSYDIRRLCYTEQPNIVLSLLLIVHVTDQIIPGNSYLPNNNTPVIS